MACPLILSLSTDKSALNVNHLFKNMLNITIKVNAYCCRPENGSISMMIAHYYKMVHFMMKIIVLIIYAYLNL